MCSKHIQILNTVFNKLYKMYLNNVFKIGIFIII